MKDFVKKIDKQKLTVIVAVLGLFLLTAGVTYAFFTYIGSGSTENTISSDSITFLYEEKDAQGNGINITEATPVSDEVGKAGPAFNFEITSKTANKISIPYEIAVRKKAGSDNLDDIVKLYLTKVDGTGNEEEVALGTFSSFTTKTYYGHEQKLLTEQKVPQSSSNYIQKYRLRMWIDEEADFSTGNYNDKTFSVTVNVYSEGKVVTPEDMANMNNAGVLQVLLDGNEIFPVETNGTHYEETLPAGTRNAELVIKPANKYSKVEIGKTDSTYTNLIAMNPKTGIVPVASTPSMTTNAHIKLNDGDNYFKGVITAEDGVTTQTLTFKLTVPAGQAAGNRLSSMIIADNEIRTYDKNSTNVAGLYSSTDTNSGDPTYYFYGNVTNNKVRYAGHDWLAVRVNEDETTRLILADRINDTDVVVNNLGQYFDFADRIEALDYMYYGYGEVPNDILDSSGDPKPIVKDAINSWYQTNIAGNDNYSKWIADKSGNYFCEAYHAQGNRNGDPMANDVDVYYQQYMSEKLNTFKCEPDIYNHQYYVADIGLLTFDEALFAGINGQEKHTYLNTDYMWWLGSTGGYDTYFARLQEFAFFPDVDPEEPNFTPSIVSIANNDTYSYYINHGPKTFYLYARPVINLKAATTATRDGNGGYIVD